MQGVQNVREECPIWNFGEYQGPVAPLRMGGSGVGVGLGIQMNKGSDLLAILLLLYSRQSVVGGQGGVEVHSRAGRANSNVKSKRLGKDFNNYICNIMSANLNEQ